MLDKRALKNEGIYGANQEETLKLVASMDLDALRKEHSEVVNQVGTCVVSTLDVVDAMEDRDCMCIGLSIHRPEAAIADPSRLVIEAVYPSYMTAQSFIAAATFNIQKKSLAHGGFGKEHGELAIGMARESISGLMGLYLFEEHWRVTTKNIQPVYGMMFTLDVMGYS